MCSQQCRVTIQVLESSSTQNPKLRAPTSPLPSSQDRCLKYHIRKFIAHNTTSSSTSSIAIICPNHLPSQLFSVSLNPSCNITPCISINQINQGRCQRWQSSRLLASYNVDAIGDNGFINSRRLSFEVVCRRRWWTCWCGSCRLQLRDFLRVAGDERSNGEGDRVWDYRESSFFVSKVCMVVYRGRDINGWCAAISWHGSSSHRQINCTTQSIFSPSKENAMKTYSRNRQYWIREDKVVQSM